MLKTINHKISQAFSEAAQGYDQASDLHQDIAHSLIGRVKGLQPRNILDIGCGTGRLTAKVRDFFPASRVTGVDFAPGMLRKSSQEYQGIAWVLANALDLPFGSKNFDLVFSNLALQWAGGVEGIARVFSEARRVLCDQGVFACALFGRQTCEELFQSLEMAGGVLRFQRLCKTEQVAEALSLAGFQGPQIDCQHIKLRFDDMKQLMGWLKAIGANQLSREGFMGPGLMGRAAQIYHREFAYQRGIGATFEVIWIYARKNNEA